MREYVKYVLFFSPIIWGINPVAMKIANQYLSTNETTFFRLLISFLVITVIAFQSKQFRKQKLKSLIYDARFMMIYFAIFQYFFGLGVNQIPAGISSVIFGTFPILMLIVTLYTGTEQPNIRTITCVLLSIVGVLAIVLFDQVGSSDSISILGVLFVVIAEIIYALFTLESKKVSGEYPPLAILSVTLAFTTFSFFLLTAKDLSMSTVTTLPTQGWMALLFCGVFAIGFANILWIWASSLLEGTVMSLYHNVSSVVGIIMGYLLLDERITLVQTIGILMIFLSLYISQMKKMKNIDLH